MTHNHGMKQTPLSADLESVLTAVEAMDDNPLLRQAHLFNALSLLHTTLGEGSWVGLYYLRDDELILGPFQGTMACERIRLGKGVVGESFSKGVTLSVTDVSTWPNYICCDASAKSEICVPIQGPNPAVLDIDLPYVHDYSGEKELFEKLAISLARFL